MAKLDLSGVFEDESTESPAAGEPSTSPATPDSQPAVTTGQPTQPAVEGEQDVQPTLPFGDGVEGVEPEPQVPPSLAQQMMDLGFQGLEGPDDSSAADRLLAAYQQQQQQNEQLQQQYDQQRRLAELQQLQQQQQVPGPQQPTATPQDRKPWESPPLSMSVQQLAQWRETNDKGQEVWRRDTPASVLQEGEPFLKWYRDFHNEWDANPMAAARPMIEHVVQEQFEQMFGQRMQQQTEEQLLQQFEAENASWMYQQDPATQKPAVSMATRQYIPTVAGQNFIDTLQRLDGSNLSVAERIEMAKQIANPQTGVTAEQSAREVAVQKKENVLRRNVPSPVTDRTGTFPQPGEKTSQNPRLTAQERFLQNLELVDDMNVA